MNEEKKPYAPNRQPDKNGDMKIVGYNLLAFLMYGLVLLSCKNGGIVVFGLLFICQVIFCVGAALYERKWVWFLSGVLILIIGFSTCASFMGA